MANMVASRPPSQTSAMRMSVNLPQINHPLSRLSNTADMDVRGVSRADNRPESCLDTARSVNIGEIARKSLTSSQGRNLTSSKGRNLTSSQGRPLAAEDGPHPVRRISSRLSTLSKEKRLAPLVHESIPEGVEVAQGDPNSTRMPIFGKGAEVASRLDTACSRHESRASGRESRPATMARLEIDELESVIKAKMRSHFNEVKKRFKDNDPEQKGNVSKEGLKQIIITITARPVSTSQYMKLLQRIGFTDKNVIHYSDFFAAFRDASDKEYPKWMDPVQRYQVDKVTMSAAQVHQHLKHQARQRFLDIADLVPQLNPDGAGYIERGELHNVLLKMNFHMEPEEFDKLWKKYDPSNRGTIKGEKLLNLLGIQITKTSDGHRPETSEQVTARSTQSDRSPRAKEIERKRSLDIERWLKSKFREGFQVMRAAFEKRDPESTGIVPHDAFLAVLEAHGLSLEPHLLPAFLSRCSITNSKQGVPYRDFLHRFQDRSLEGIPNEIMSNPMHKFNNEERPMTEGDNLTFTNIEVQLMNMFQRDFLGLLAFFKRLDRYSLGVVSQEEFRAAIESRFGLQLTDQQYTNLLDTLPLNEEGSVCYQEFMQNFDTKGMAPSLFEKPTTPTSSSEPNILVVDTPDHPRRSHRELFVIIKDLLHKQYSDVEREFYDMDDINSRTLSQEAMYKLLLKFDIEVTRREIRDLWSTFITNSHKTLDFAEFLRHFGYSQRSAAFPNAKVAPPRRGDADFRMRSRKLNCAADMLQDNLKAKIDYRWEELRQEFMAMDKYHTQHVDRDEFREVLMALCPNLSDYELDILVKKFSRKTDGSISYVEFLKPYVSRRQGWRHGNNMLSLLQHPQGQSGMYEAPPPVQQRGLSAVTASLKDKLSGDWRSLRKAFRTLDATNEGTLTMKDFRSVLKLADVVLEQDDVYDIMNEYDQDMTGKVPYERFINDAFKPHSQQNVYKIC